MGDRAERYHWSNSVDIAARDTVLTGGLIARAWRDKNGGPIDQGNLSLQTDIIWLEEKKSLASAFWCRWTTWPMRAPIY